MSPLPRLSKTVLALGLVLYVAACTRRPAPQSETWLSMGTFMTVTTRGADAQTWRRAATDAQQTVRDLDARLTVFDDHSEVSRINTTAGGDPAPISPDTQRVLELSLRFAALSQGSFDPTAAPLVRLWGFNGGTVPLKAWDTNAVAAVQELCGYRLLSLDDGTASLSRAGAQLDLGGIAKGYAVDRCFTRLVEMGLRDLMVNLGGNIRCSGESAPGRPWRIGVRNPFDVHETIGRLTLPGGTAVATSGNYERFVTIDGRRYAHIVDPRNGYPVTGMAGVTVIAPTAVEADALSTALFVMGIEEGAALLAGRPNCHALFIPDPPPLRLLATTGFLEHFEPDPSCGPVTPIAVSPPR